MNEKSAEAQFTRAVNFLRRGDASSARPLMTKVVRAYPQSAPAHFMLGIACAMLSDNKRALECFDRAVEVDSSFIDAYINKGVVLKKMAFYDAAVACYDRALVINPRSAESYNNRGSAYLGLGRLHEAVEDFNHAITLNPTYADAYCNMGGALADSDAFAEALSMLDRAIELAPAMAEAHLNRGNALNGLRRFEEAVVSYEQALKLRPNYSEALCNRGHSLVELNRYEDALHSYNQAIKLEKNYASAFNGKAKSLVGLKKIDEALVCYERAIELKPEDALYEWGKALLLILQGNYEEGWRLYESRKRHKKFKENICRIQDFAQPLWLGEVNLSGKTILLHHEQGLGDTLQMLRYVPLLAKFGGDVVVQVPASLVQIAASADPAARIVAKGNPLPEFDLQCSFMSLPGMFRTTLDTVPSAVPYLQASKSSKQYWHQKLGDKSKYRIGLVWSGSAQHRNDHNRSIPLMALLPLLDIDAEFFSLQNEYREADGEVLRQKGQIQDHAKELGTFNDTAGFIEQLDLIISVDTAIAHLAGALGKPVWLLLPYSPDYRWGLEQSESAWYPSARLFRQPRAEDWESVVQTVANEVSKLVTA
ncbi:TPR repeat-containing protein [Pseudogulbenkiania sp. NH8B]|uniref:tetratricopeptide repeat-containing glycosyltransferase family protein n=1 Tax=Pseudogulbenkiania sp. (strain NH8B) TaxID=748280 RepID=UPI000227A437|nr:tetratricopeptide repeat-containing glycosyltransferase family protein [Pseudogulbenkiania sp. NH8B]BAK78191.1 TPR repeat-containing protein [Pseudogulbenkiania sp. NH8B]